MWILLNDAMFSIVEDMDNEKQLLVRARRKGDIEKVFDLYKGHVAKCDDCDYRYRIFADRDYVKKKIAREIDNIDYYNFKASVKDGDLKFAYGEIWRVLKYLLK